jgi:hypothetical protein
MMMVANQKSCCVVVRGTTTLGFVGLYIATLTACVIGATAMVFGLFAFCCERSLLDSFALSPLHFFISPSLSQDFFGLRKDNPIRSSGK